MTKPCLDRLLGDHSFLTEERKSLEICLFSQGGLVDAEEAERIESFLNDDRSVVGADDKRTLEILTTVGFNVPRYFAASHEASLKPALSQARLEVLSSPILKQIPVYGDKPDAVRLEAIKKAWAVIPDKLKKMLGEQEVRIILQKPAEMTPRSSQDYRAIFLNSKLAPEMMESALLRACARRLASELNLLSLGKFDAVTSEIFYHVLDLEGFADPREWFAQAFQKALMQPKSEATADRRINLLFAKLLYSLEKDSPLKASDVFNWSNFSDSKWVADLEEANPNARYRWMEQGEIKHLEKDWDEHVNVPGGKGPLHYLTKRSNEIPVFRSFWFLETVKLFLNRSSKIDFKVKMGANELMDEIGRVATMRHHDPFLIECLGILADAYLERRMGWFEGVVGFEKKLFNTVRVISKNNNSAEVSVLRRKIYAAVPSDLLDESFLEEETDFIALHLLLAKLSDAISDHGGADRSLDLSWQFMSAAEQNAVKDLFPEEFSHP